MVSVPNVLLIRTRRFQATAFAMPALGGQLPFLREVIRLSTASVRPEKPRILGLYLSSPSWLASVAARDHFAAGVDQPHAPPTLSRLLAAICAAIADAVLVTTAMMEKSAIYVYKIRGALVEVMLFLVPMGTCRIMEVRLGLIALNLQQIIALLMHSRPTIKPAAVVKAFMVLQDFLARYVQKDFTALVLAIS
jgi:hypothetical protein